MTIMERLAGAFENRAKSDAEQYWAAIQNEDANPELVMTLADQMGKGLDDIRIDHDLFLRAQGTPKPDHKKTQRTIKRLMDESAKASAKADELFQEALEQTYKAAKARDQASYERKQADMLSKEYNAIIRELAERGHPGFSAEVHSINEARLQERERVLSERRESELLQVIQRIERDLPAYEEAVLSGKTQYNLTIEQMQEELKTAQRELQELREHG